jgi:hypothetical protein
MEEMVYRQINKKKKESRVWLFFERMENKWQKEAGGLS